MPRLLAPVLAACALLVGACGGGAEQVQSADPGKPAGPATTPSPQATDSPVATQPQQQVPALDFSASAIGGGDIRAASFAGRPVVLWFWSPW